MSEYQENLGKHLEVLSEKLSSIEQSLAKDTALIATPNNTQRTEAFWAVPGRGAKYPTEGNGDLVGGLKEPLPDKRLVQRLMDLRNLRTAFFEEDIFGEPAWDMLLDLVIARIECRRVSITSLCIASGVASTTALRWINRLVEVGLVDREADDSDGRRTFVSLSDAGARQIADCFARWQNLKIL